MCRPCRPVPPGPTIQLSLSSGRTFMCYWPVPLRSSLGVGGAFKRANGHSCPRQGLWPFLLSLAALFGPRLCALLACRAAYCFVLGVAFGHVTLLLRASPLWPIGLPCCILPLSSAWPWLLLLSLAASSGRASVRYEPVVLHIALSSAWSLAIYSSSPSLMRYWPVLLHSSLVLGMAFGRFSYLCTMWKKSCRKVPSYCQSLCKRGNI